MLNKVCFVSIDIEHDNKKETKEFKGIENLGKILSVFKKYDIQATLFVTGEALEKYQDRFKELANSYEIASHGFTHRFWNTLNLEERKQEIKSFANLYQQIFQALPRGFRAPSHIIDKEGIKLLENKGFLYDSSIVPHYPPFKKYRGYKSKAPLQPYYPNEDKILEIPAAGQLFGIPLAGAWIRGLPVCFYKILFLLHRPNFITLNMHSWDVLDPCFLQKLEKILKILKSKNYLFLNGEQIFENRR